MKLIRYFFILLLFSSPVRAQLKFIIEDFEGFANGTSDLKLNGIYTYGNIKADIEPNTSELAYSGAKFIKIYKEGNIKFGGWGKGINQNVMLDVNTDHLNFYVYQPASNDTNTIKIELLDDDNENNAYEKDKDDSWVY